jgi:excisionase family DNA binding protein
MAPAARSRFFSASYRREAGSRRSRELFGESAADSDFLNLPHQTTIEPMTVAEVAELLRTSRKAIYSMVERKQLPGVLHINRRVLVDRTVLLDWLRQKSTPLPGKER